MAVGIGGVFSLLFHMFVVERSDEEVKKTVSLIEANTPRDPRRSSNISSERRQSRGKELLDSLTKVTTVASSMNISKIQAQARRRSRRTASLRSEGEAGQSLLSSQDDNMEEPTVVVGDSTAVNTLSANVPSNGTPNQPQMAVPIMTHSITEIATGRYCTKSLNTGRDKMTVRDWLSLPQFYIVALMYMATRLSVNVTQVYMPLFVIESLHMPCSAIASVPLTMYVSGFVIALFIKLINKYFGRQLAYVIGAVLCATGACLVLFLDPKRGEFLAEDGIYVVAVLLGNDDSFNWTICF
jgi:hypothetical protein